MKWVIEYIRWGQGRSVVWQCSLLQVGLCMICVLIIKTILLLSPLLIICIVSRLAYICMYACKAYVCVYVLMDGWMEKMCIIHKWVAGMYTGINDHISYIILYVYYNYFLCCIHYILEPLS